MVPQMSQSEFQFGGAKQKKNWIKSNETNVRTEVTDNPILVTTHDDVNESSIWQFISGNS